MISQSNCDIIWNPVPLVQGRSTKWEQYILFWIQGGTRKGKFVHTCTDKSVLTNDISMTAHTGMYQYVPPWTALYQGYRIPDVFTIPDASEIEMRLQN